ncbi:MAG: metallophosphoesterase [Ruminococcus sp.]|nr:metallophosphoesterase [Ruminococcus sp.]
MKILLLSDSHGNIRDMMSATEKYGRNADIIVHCGDGTRGEAMQLMQSCPDKTVVCVRGNCDFGSMLRYTEYLNVFDKKIMITHGHLFDVKFGLEKLSYKAEEENCDLVFFGHTHIPTDVRLGNVRMINPGSSGKYNPTCATVEIDQKGNVLVNHMEI